VTTIVETERSILDVVAAGLIVVGPDRRVTHWNAWMVAASRRTAADAVGKEMSAVFPEARLAALTRAIDSAIEAGASTLLTNTLHPELLPLRTLAGRPLLHDVMILPIGSTPKTGCVIQIADVTESTRRERFLRDRQNARYHALVEGAPDVIINVDSAGVIQLANPASERVFGYTGQELIGVKAETLFEPTSAWASISASANLPEPPERPFEVCIRLKNGTLRYFEVSAARWLDGTRAFVTAILRDVNDRRATDLALRESERRARENATALEELNLALKASGKTLNEMDRRKDEFLATLAHELRNPLAPLRNGLQLLKLATDNPELIERTRQMMDHQVTQMVRLIDDLLDVSRITNDQIQLTKEITTLDKIISQAVETSRPIVDAQQHKLTIGLPAGEILLEADAVRLTQVFSNLLNNAAKYTPPGGAISIEGRQRDQEVVVSITDTGIGIPKEMLPRVFDMFVQVDKSLERAQGGLGIGLSLVRRLVELHGGSVEGHSKGVGSGSQFTVRLPIAQWSAGAGRAVSEGAATSESIPQRILIADDNEDAAASLAMILRMQGHDTRTAKDGADTLEVAAEFQPDVVLLDIGMPKLNGYETARRLRSAPASKRVLLVALTGWGQESDRLRSSAAGFDAHLVKPVKLDQIERLLADNLPAQAARRTSAEH